MANCRPHALGILNLLLIALPSLAYAQELHEKLIAKWETPLEITGPVASSETDPIRFGYALEYENASSNGSSVSFTNLSMKMKVETPDGYTNFDDQLGELTISSLTIEGVEELADGSIIADTLLAEDLVSTTPLESSILTSKFTTWQCDSLHIPSPDGLSPLRQYIAFASFFSGRECTIDSGAMLFGDEPFVTHGRITATQKISLNEGVLDYSMTLDDGIVSLAGLPRSPENTQARSFLAAIGYGDEFEFNINAKMFWNLESGEFTLDDVSLNVVEMGQIYLSLGIDGLTETILNTLVASNSPQAAGMTALTMSFAGFEVGAVDTVLAERLLEFGEMAGEQSRDDIIEQVTSAVRHNVEPQIGKEFADQIVDAITRYINDPQNFNISAFPPAPVNFAQIGIVGASIPSQLPSLLNVEISVNGQ